MERNNNALEAIVDGTSWRHHRAIWVRQLIQALLDDQTNQPVGVKFEIAARGVPVAKILRNEWPKYEKDTQCWYFGNNNVTHLSRIIVCNSLIWSFCSSTLRLLPNLYSLGFVPLLLTVPISFYFFRITGKLRVNFRILFWPPARECRKCIFNNSEDDISWCVRCWHIPMTAIFMCWRFVSNFLCKRLSTLKFFHCRFQSPFLLWKWIFLSFSHGCVVGWHSFSRISWWTSKRQQQTTICELNAFIWQSFALFVFFRRFSSLTKTKRVVTCIHTI